MAALNDEFETALGQLEPSDDDKENAPKAHEDVRGVLADDTTLSEYGIDPILIGSYKRHVSIRRVKDVDVFCRLPDLPEDVSAEDLLGHFEAILTEAYGKTSDGEDRVTKQARSVQVLFPEFDGLYVDAVPARPRTDGTWEIPQHESNEWQQTNPDEMTALSSAMNDKHGDFYVPGVKLLRQTRRALLGKTNPDGSHAKTYPGGLYVELALYNACDRELVSGKSQAEFYAAALEGAATLMEEHSAGTLMPDPTLPGETVKIRATAQELNKAGATFRDAAVRARAAFENDNRCAAAKEFRALLGKNGDDEIVFPRPDDCTEDGEKKSNGAPVVAGDRTVPAGNRRYG